MDTIVDVKRLVCEGTQPTFNYSEKDTPVYCSKCKVGGTAYIQHTECIACKETQSHFESSRKW